MRSNMRYASAEIFADRFLSVPFVAEVGGHHANHVRTVLNEHHP